MLDNKSFLEQANWTRKTNTNWYYYQLDLPSEQAYNLFIGTINKDNVDKGEKEYLYLRISNDNFKTFLEDIEFYGIGGIKRTSVNFDLKTGYSARIYKYSTPNILTISDLISDVRLREAIKIPYRDIQSSHLPSFNKYVLITNGEEADMNLSYFSGGSLYNHIRKMSANIQICFWEEDDL